MNHTNAPGKSHILTSSIGFIVLGVIVALGVAYLLASGMIAISQGIFSFIDVGFWLTTGILGIIYHENLSRAKVLRGLGIAAIAFPILAALYNGPRVFHLIMMGAAIYFLVGTQQNVSAFKEVSKNESVRLGFLALERGEWHIAWNFFEQVLRIKSKKANPKNANAYIGKLCVELRLPREEDLLCYGPAIQSYGNYQSAMQCADEPYKATLRQHALTTAELAAKIEQARADKDFKECRTLVDALKKLPDSEGTARLRAELGTVTVDLEGINREFFHCPICGTRQVPERKACTMCDIDFIKPA